MANTEEGFNIVLGLDYSQLEKGLKGVQENLKATKVVLKEIDKQLKIEPNNIELWKKKQKLLNEQVEDTKKKLKYQDEMLKVLIKDYDGTDKAKTKIEKLKEQIEGTNRTLKVFTAQAESASTKVKSLATSFDAEKIKKIGSSLTKHLTLPIISTATALGTLVYKTSSSINSLKDNAEAVNANVEAYQELIYAAKLTGAKEDALQKTFIKVNSMLGDIASGDSLTVAQNLHKIGLSIDDIKGKSSDQAFLTIREALSKIEDESLRVAYANEIFGDKLGSELLPLLKAEDSQIEALRNEARKYGVATEEQVETSGKFHDELDRLKQALFGVSLELMEDLLPVLEKLVISIREDVIPKISSFKESWDNLNPSTKKIIKNLALVTATIGPLITVIGTVVESVIKFKKGFTALKTAATALTSLGLSPTTLAIGTLIAVIAGALISNEDFRSSIVDLFKSLSPLIKSLGELVSTLGEALKPILDLIVSVITDLVKLFTPIIEFLAQIIGEYIGAVVEGLKKTIELFSPIIEFLGELIGSAIQLGLEAFGGLFKDIVTVFKEVYSVVKEKLGPIFEWFRSIIDVVKDAVSGLIDKLKTAIQKLEDWLGTYKKATLEENKNQFGEILPPLGVGGAFEGAFKPQSASGRIVNNSVSVYTSANAIDINTLNAALGGSYL